jgi:hypothetical protein
MMRTKLKYGVVTFALFLALSMSLEPRAHAYVDPGSGLLAIQTFSAVVTSGLFYFRRRIKALLSLNAPTPANAEPGPEEFPAS